MESYVIDNFVREFYKEIDTYEKVKREVHKFLETKLNDSGIMALVTSRVKDPGRLKEKLINRNREKKYKDSKDIYSDIVDLIGLRVALYFPNDASRVETIIKSQFKIDIIKNFPQNREQNEVYNNRFEGYSATHYRILYSFENKEYKVEIQVASLLMHAWAEVEHDLAYKQKKGLVSYEEYEALDEINGLVIAGEISLQRLQRVSELRMASENETFSNHYQLADYIYNDAEKRVQGDAINIGDVETLYKFLKKRNRLTKKKVDNDLAKVDFTSEYVIADQIMDNHIDNKNSGIDVITIRADKDIFNNQEINYEYIGKFLAEWINLEKLVNELSTRFGSFNMHNKKDAMSKLTQCLDLPQQIVNDYWQLKKIRNVLVHSIDIPSDDDLLHFIDEIIRVRKEIKSLFNGV